MRFLCIMAEKFYNNTFQREQHYEKVHVNIFAYIYVYELKMSFKSV